MDTTEKSKFSALQQAVKIVKDSGAFDEKYYFSQIQKEEKPSNPIKHYFLHGWELGYNPHPCFDTRYYFQSNSDIKALNIHPFLHFVLYGHNEARSTKQGFFLPSFRKAHPEVERTGINPLKLYTQLYGQRWPAPKTDADADADADAFGRGSNHAKQPQPTPAATAVLSKQYFIAEPPSNRTDYIGRIDVVKNGRIAGWVVNQTDRTEQIQIEILINGILFTTRNLTVERQDVSLIYPGNPVCGFDIHLAANEIPVERAVIAIRVKNTQTYLNTRSPAPIIQTRTQKNTSVRQAMSRRAQSVAIVIPIYNAPDALVECIESVLRHTDISPTGHHLILSDDASPDEKIGEILARYEGNESITIIRNKQNAGYTGNINTAISSAGNRDVVLLNSDTRVTPNWVELLQRTAMQSIFIGTVSAVSDNAGAFSVPVRNSANSTPAWLSEDEYARLITHTSKLQHPRLPTNSGFCMYIKHEVFDAIGLFDDKNFPRGYGEENDFCMRAGHLGWEHVLADNVIIYHERSASFKDTKNALMNRASDLIPKMYPEYQDAVAQSFVNNKDLNHRRFHIAYSAVRHPKIPRPRVAYVIGVESGGTPQTNMDLMSTIQHDYEPYLILCNTFSIKIFQIQGSNRIELENIHLSTPVSPITHDSPAYKKEIADILQRYSFELVHIRHIGRHGLSLIHIAKALKIKVIFSLHDFYTICPNVKLLDAENNFCAGQCTEAGQDCNVELWDARFTPILKDGWVHSWKKVFQNILASCDALITTSPYAKELISSTYDISNVRFDVIPHARDFDSFELLASNSEPQISKLRVFVPGHLVPAKGLQLIKEIKNLDTSNRIEFHFAGTAKENLQDYGVCHGTYKREDFSALVNKIRPHVGAVLSIWPETYSHTLTELWSCGIPVITSDYGATGERLRVHGGGWIVDDMSAPSILATLLKIISTPEDIKNQVKSIIDWQTNYGKNYNIEVMTSCYKRLYGQVLCQASPENNKKETFVIPITNTNRRSYASTDHIKAILKNLLNQSTISAWPASTINIIDYLPTPDAIVFQYHAEPTSPEYTSILSSLKHTHPHIKLIVEICGDSTIARMGDHTISEYATLSWLLNHCDQILAPPELTNYRSVNFMAPDLKVMLEDESDTAVLPVPGVTSSQPIPNAVTYDDSLYESITKTHPKGLHLINCDNARYVAANATLIDWSKLANTPKVKGLVSIVIPNFDKVGMTEKLLLTLFNTTRGATPFEVILVDNGSRPEVRAQIEQLASIDSRLTVVCTPVPLMFSVGCNYGAAHANGEYVLFLNNDMEILHASWLDTLFAPLVNLDDVGIVGAKLLYGDGTVQHAGLVFSDQSNMAYHAYLGADKNAPHVNKRRQMQAVTGACLGMRVSDLVKLRGFNPLFINGCEDVDLCLRMQHVLHRKTVYIPEAEVLHLEGKSPGRGKHVLANRMIFNELWRERIVPDDKLYYLEDGYSVISYAFDNLWLKPDYRSVTVEIDKHNIEHQVDGLK